MRYPSAASGPLREPFVGGGALPLPKTGLVEVTVDGEIVVYDPEADLLHHLDRSASTVWSRLDGNVTAEALGERIAAHLRAPAMTVRRDILDLTLQLWERGLLRGSTAHATASQPLGLGLESQPLDSPRGDLRLDGQSLPDAPYRTGCFRALEHVFEVATNDVAVRDFLEEVLVDLTDTGNGKRERHELLHIPDAPHGERFRVLHNGELVRATDWLDRAIAVLLWKINAEVVRQSTQRYPLVHAAAAVSDGVAVLLPAPAESGKTTTVAGLVRAGFGYLTDEAVAIHPDTLLAQPYPKALSVDRGSWEVLADLRPQHHDRVAGQWHVPARLIRSGAVAGPAPIRFVVAPAYRLGSTTELEPISRGDMLMRLADSTFRLQDDAQRNLAVLARVVTSADCYRLTVGDLDHAIGFIEELVRSEQLDVSEREPPFAQRRH
jgi:Coenzyme PQQ synthesis protein D (PqqD)